MKWFISSLFIIGLFFTMGQATVSAEKLFPTNHVFTIKFTQPVDLQDLQQKLYVLKGEEETVEVEIKPLVYNGKETEVLVAPLRQWEPGKRYWIFVDEGLVSKAGIKLKKSKTLSFLTEATATPIVESAETATTEIISVEPVKVKTDVVSEGKYAPISREAREYISTKLNRYEMQLADYYYSDDLTLSMIDLYNDYFENTMLPYTRKMFPQVTEHKAYPTFVFLADHEAEATRDFASNFYSGSELPYGWFGSGNNVVVMTKYNTKPPYTTINTILFPHEYFHWIVHNVYNASIPSWLNEGIAYYFSWAMYDRTSSFMESSLYERSEQTFRNSVENQIESNIVYMVVVPYMQSMYGAEKLEKLLIQSATMNFDEAFKQVYGKTVKEMVEETTTYIQGK